MVKEQRSFDVVIRNQNFFFKEDFLKQRSHQVKWVFEKIYRSFSIFSPLLAAFRK